MIGLKKLLFSVNSLAKLLDLATEKGSSMWLTSLPLKEMGFNLNKREFRDGLSLRYDWPIGDISSTCLVESPLE